VARRQGDHDARPHPFLRRPVAILGFGGTADSDVVFREGPPDEVEDRPPVVARVREAFDRLSDLALDNRPSIDLIEGMAHLPSS
jgi:hypothetical protein